MGVHAAIRTQDGRGIGTEMGRKEETRRRRLNRQAATGRNGLFKIKKGKLPSSLLIASTQTNESNPAAKGCRKSS